MVKLVTANGVVAALYRYNAWGESLESTGEMASINPLRYRGYYYDTETGFYYLQSRYYDPANHRFINADEAEYSAISAYSTNDTNLFTYCGNNPVTRADDGGQFWNIIVGAVVGVVAQYVPDVVTNLASGDSVLEALVPSSSIADYAGAAASGALAATGIGMVGSVAANAAIGGATYLANTISDGQDPTWSGFVGSSVVGGISGMVGGSGLSASKVRGIKDTAKHVLKTAVSPKKLQCTVQKLQLAIRRLLQP